MQLTHQGVALVQPEVMAHVCLVNTLPKSISSSPSNKQIFQHKKELQMPLIPLALSQRSKQDQQRAGNTGTKDFVTFSSHSDMSESYIIKR